tara:strand:+ start:476 stop:619 length:144 start_codon:yes stop_codon:yes gene_type:complete
MEERATPMAIPIQMEKDLSFFEIDIKNSFVAYVRVFAVKKDYAFGKR